VIVPLSKFVPRGFGFVHHSIAILYHEVPNPNLTIRDFFIAVGGRLVGLRYPADLLPEVKAVLEAAKLQDLAANGAVKSRGVTRVRALGRHRLMLNCKEPIETPLKHLLNCKEPIETPLKHLLNAKREWKGALRSLALSRSLSLSLSLSLSRPQPALTMVEICAHCRLLPSPATTLDKNDKPSRGYTVGVREQAADT
jgi:hypothetical protein